MSNVAYTLRVEPAWYGKLIIATLSLLDKMLFPCRVTPRHEVTDPCLNTLLKRTRSVGQTRSASR